MTKIDIIAALTNISGYTADEIVKAYHSGDYHELGTLIAQAFEHWEENQPVETIGTYLRKSA